MPTALRLSSRTRLAFALIATLFGVSLFIQQMYFARRVQAVSATVVISEFRVRGPNGAADEFVELYNLTNSPINIGGWKINGSNNAATVSTRLTITAGTTIPAHGHFLAINSSASGGPYSGAVSGNQTFTTGITDDGGIALLDGSNVVIDQVGMSAGSAYKEGTTLASLGTSNLNRGYERKPGGASGSTQDTDNNATDFQLLAPSDPQNLSSAPTPSGNQAIVPSCPASLSTDQGTATSAGVSATDPDGTVTGASITSAAVAGITLDSFVAASGVGGTATATLNVANTTAAGNYNVTIRYSNNDPTPQTADCTIAVTVFAPTPPTGVGAANPNSVPPGGTTLLTVTVTPGTHPASTGISVTGDLSSIGGSAAQVFSDNATNGDVTAGDNIFSFSATVSGGTTAGGKTLPTTITDSQSRVGNANISLTITSSTTNPSGTGAATPSSVAAGGTTLLTVTVTPGTGPTSTGLAVTGDLSQIGGTADQQFFDGGSNGDATPGDNVFSFNATVASATTAGDKNLPFGITDAQGRNGSGSISLAVRVPAGAVVISQVYGGGGNSGATLKNDFIEIFNRGSATVDLSGWSVQYASAAATTAWQRTPLTGTLAPGQYYLIQEAAGAGGSVDLPTPDATGSIPMSGTNANIALVSNNITLATGCPGSNPQLIDLVGYGTAACFEGPAAAPGLSNTTADLRKRGGCKDTDDNSQDFLETSPNPRNKAAAFHVCPVSGDLSPEVESVSPANGAPGIDSNSDITVSFDEPVNLSANWIQISCANSGLHTFTTTGGPTTFTVNPDADFNGAEQCIVTVVKTEVFDQDLVDPPDNMDADYVFSFTTAIARDPAEHMVMGNPSGAVFDENVPLNYLMMKKQYALSYNNDKGTANWTSWHLDSTWTTGVADRQNDFRSDETLPPSFKHVSSGYNFATYGFDRGHMCPSADRTSSIADNSATFYMTNMIPQASGNNQGPWGSMENYIRTQLNGNANELYIISGGTGVGGNSSTGHWDNIIDTAGNSVTVPQFTWKVVMVLPNDVGDDVVRVDGSTRTFAVIMPNDDNIRPDQWQKYLATVDQVEALSGFDFYSNVPAAIQDVFEAKLDTVNDTAPVTSGQSKTTAEDQSVAVTLSATDFNVNNTFTYTIVDQPLHGSVLCTAGACNYSPNANYFGPDSFTFKANDGALDSNVSTVNISVTEVNDDPTAASDNKETPEDSSLIFPSSDLTSNDSAGPGETQALTVDSVISTVNTHGSINLSAGQITYSPASNYNGPASFDYHVCDDGTTNGAADPKCTTGTVNVNVTPVQDAPDAVDDSPTINEDSGANTINVRGNDVDVDGDTLVVTAITQGAHGTVAITNAGADVSYTPAANFFGSDSFTYTVNDGHGDSDTATVNVTINNVNDAPVANGESYVTDSNTTLNVAAPGVLANDSDIDSPSLTSVLVSNVSHGSLSLNTNGSFSYTPDLNFEGADSFTYHAYDSAAYSNTVTVNITVNDKVPPVITSAVAISSISSTNSNMINVGLTASATDNSGDAVTIEVAVFGDEDDQTPTFHTTVFSPDAKDIAPVTLRLRGERVEDSDGRVYLIVITATDSSGNISRNYETVVVPKSNKQGNIDSVNAQAAAAKSYAQGNGTPPPGYFVIGDGPIIGPKQ